MPGIIFDFRDLTNFTRGGIPKQRRYRKGISDIGRVANAFPRRESAYGCFAFPTSGFGMSLFPGGFVIDEDGMIVVACKMCAGFSCFTNGFVKIEPATTVAHFVPFPRPFPVRTETWDMPFNKADPPEGN